MSNGDYYKTPKGASIATGVLFALVMFGNVWGVIWRKQKIVIASAQGVQAGREADPAAAPAGRAGLLASRTNTLLSIPMLFFMGATSHLVEARAAGFNTQPEGSDRAMYWAVVLITLLLIELNALGVLGGTAASPIRSYLETHRATIIAGFVYAAIVYVVFEMAFGL